jgi:hypothetical protein
MGTGVTLVSVSFLKPLDALSLCYISREEIIVFLFTWLLELKTGCDPSCNSTTACVCRCHSCIIDLIYGRLSKSLRLWSSPSEPTLPVWILSKWPGAWKLQLCFQRNEYVPQCIKLHVSFTWCRILLGKLIVDYMVTNFTFYKTRIFITCPQDAVVNQTNLFHIITTCCLKMKLTLSYHLYLCLPIGPFPSSLIIINPCGCRFSLRRWPTSTRVHGAKCQKTGTFMLSALRTSDITLGLCASLIAYLPVIVFQKS